MHLLQRFCGAIKAPGLSQASQSASLRTTLLTNERWSVGAIGSGQHSGQTMWLQEPSFLCRSLPVSSHSPFCLPLSAVSPVLHSDLLEFLLTSAKLLGFSTLGSSGSLHGSLILSVILKKRVEMAQFLFSCQLGIRAPWHV